MSEAYKKLMTAYNALVEPLKSRLAEVNESLGALSDQKRETVLNAQIAVLDRKIEEATALDEVTQAKNFDTELATVRTELDDLIASKKSEHARLSAEIERVNTEIQAVAGKVMKESFPVLHETFITELNRAIDLVEDIKRGCASFVSETGAKLPVNFHDRFRFHNHTIYGKELRDLYRRFDNLGWL